MGTLETYSVRNTLPYDCFISYASPDLSHAEALYQRLIACGFSVWFDKARLREGCLWHEEIEAGCETSRVILPVLTPNWKLSEWTRYETYGGEAIIPVLAEGAFQDVATPPLRQVQTKLVSLTQRAEEEWEHLFTEIRAALAREPPPRAERLVNLRVRANPNFVGREKTLEEIHEKLFTSPATVLMQGKIEVITALGGVGKTALARQYAEKFWRCYREIYWADCRLQLVSELARIHDIMRPEPVYAALKDADKATWVRQELNQGGGRPLRLLILDNAEDQRSVLEWIPTTGRCHTLITSRFTEWKKEFELCPVWLLEPEPARELLLRRAGKREADGETEIVDEVAQKLGYLPLALEQAAAYVENQGPGFRYADYLRLYTEHEATFLAEWNDDWSSTDYPHSVFLTWRATIDKLPAGARAILRICSFLAAAPIPADMLVKGVAVIAEEAKLVDEYPCSVGEVQVNKWKADLARYSMVQLLEGQMFSIHGLVQAVERQQVVSEVRRRIVAHAVDLVTSFAPGNAWRFENWAPWRVLRPHGQCLWDWYRRDPSIALNPTFLREFGNFLHFQGAYDLSESILRCALDVNLGALGADDPATLSTGNDLAVLLASKGDIAGAEPLYRRALKVREATLGMEHPETIIAAHNLATCIEKRDPSKAEALYRRVVETSERLMGAEHPDTLMFLTSWASFLADEHSTEAESLYRRVLDARNRVLGADHADTLVSLNLLALHLRNQGRDSDAEPLYRRALEAREQALGPEHPDTLISMNNLSDLLQRKGDFIGAKTLCVRALESKKRVLGTHHRSTLISTHNLAYLLNQMGNFAEAGPLFREALAGMRQVLGETDSATRLFSENYRTFLKEQHNRGGQPE
jgi:tetratricopeptide (TPR) repeat protein